MTYDEFINNILITRGRFGCGDTYHERHHIIPRCLGGNNHKNNLIDLFAREHFIAHRLLVQENPDNIKLIHCWTFLARLNQGDSIYELSPEEYEEAKLAFSKLVKGVPLSEEHKKKIGKANKGRIVPNDARKAVSLANKTRIWTQESRQKMSRTLKTKSPWKGRRHSEETKQKLSARRKGTQTGAENPRALVIIQLSMKDDILKIWPYVKAASQALNINAGDISGAAKGR